MKMGKWISDDYWQETEGKDNCCPYVVSCGAQILGVHYLVKVLSIDLIMGSDIEQHNFFSGNSLCQSNTVGMSQANGMQSFQFPFESMQAERGLNGSASNPLRTLASCFFYSG